MRFAVGVLGLLIGAAPLLADTAELADRSDLESVWKPGGRTYRPVDFPYSPNPGKYGGPNRTKWGNEGYIYVNPRMYEYSRIRPLPASRELAPGVDELLVELDIMKAREAELRARLGELEDEAELLREKSEDDQIKIRMLEMQLAEIDLAALPTGETIDSGFPGTVSGPPERVDTYMVGQDQSLWSIAGRPEVYGDNSRWLLLYHANRDQIFDPDLIYPGMVLLVPRYPGLEARPEPVTNPGENAPTEQ